MFDHMTTAELTAKAKELAAALGTTAPNTYHTRGDALARCEKLFAELNAGGEIDEPATVAADEDSTDENQESPLYSNLLDTDGEVDYSPKYSRANPPANWGEKLVKYRFATLEDLIDSLNANINRRKAKKAGDATLEAKYAEEFKAAEAKRVSLKAGA